MKNGFTLIELLVVLLMVALVSGFVIPRIVTPFGNLRLKTAAAEIINCEQRNTHDPTRPKKEDRDIPGQPRNEGPYRLVQEEA